MLYNNGDEYKGHWKDDKKDGTGKVWLQGVGILSYASGDKYEGDWKENKKSGKGSCEIDV